MTWEESLDMVVARTKHEPYRQLCADSHPDHLVWRERVIARAEAIAAGTAYPPMIVQAGNAMAAVGRVAGALVTGQAVVVSAEEQERRMGICRTCEFFDACQQRCKRCGCALSLKTRLATDHCPLNPPKW